MHEGPEKRRCRYCQHAGRPEVCGYGPRSMDLEDRREPRPDLLQRRSTGRRLEGAGRTASDGSEQTLGPVIQATLRPSLDAGVPTSDGILAIALNVEHCAPLGLDHDRTADIAHPTEAL